MKGSEPEFIATETLIVADIARSVAFYRDAWSDFVARRRTDAFAPEKHLDNYPQGRRPER